VSLIRRITRRIRALRILLLNAWSTRNLGYRGEGAWVSHRAVIYERSKVHVGAGARVGDFVHIWGGGGVSIGENTLVAAHTVISSQSHRTDALAMGKLYAETLVLREVSIGKNVWISSNVTVGPGVTIGDNSILAAGTVVLSDVPSDVLAAGTPARVVRRLH